MIPPFNKYHEGKNIGNYGIFNMREDYVFFMIESLNSQSLSLLGLQAILMNKVLWVLSPED